MAACIMHVVPSECGPHACRVLQLLQLPSAWSHGACALKWSLAKITWGMHCLYHAAMSCNLTVLAGIDGSWRGLPAARFYYSNNDYPSNAPVFGCWSNAW